MDKLDTHNPNHFTYKHPPLDFSVLGGIRLEGLDRMRVTLKVQMEHLSLRHNLDLYNDNQTEKLIRKTAEKLEVGTSVIAASLAELTESLEAYRLDKIEQKESEHQIIAKQLTETERKVAELALKYGYRFSPRLHVHLFGNAWGT